MFGNNPFSEFRATQQQVQEKAVIDKKADIDGGTRLDTETSVQESKFVIPEEIPANERTAFHGAAAAAAKAGKKSFSFGGKTHPVTMAKDTAHKIADDVQKEGMYKDMDTEKSEPAPRSDDKVKSDMKKRRKKEDKTEVEMNPKMAMGKKDSSMEQKESTIREKLLAVLEASRAEKYKGATKPETMDDKLSGQGAKDMVNQPKKVDDTEEKGHQDATKAGKTGPTAKPRSGGDATRSGDQKIVQGGTPVKNLSKTMEAYASMYEGITVDYAKASKNSDTKYADPIHGTGSYRSHSDHKAHHMAALKKAGASDDHAAAIHKHASVNDDDHKKSNKPGYDYMSKQGKHTVHSKNVHIGDGGGDKIKYHVES